MSSWAQAAGVVYGTVYASRIDCLLLAFRKTSRSGDVYDAGLKAEEYGTDQCRFSLTLTIMQ